MKTLLLLALFAPPLLATTGALADDKAVCLAAASQGQVLRDAHKLVEAREQFRVCARQQCPAMVQQDCGTWLGEVERGVPTIVLAAKDAGGADLANVRVSIDGQPLVTSLDGQAVPVNPGPHTFVFEGPNGSRVERQALIKEGEKNQGVAVMLSLSNPSPPPRPANSPAPPESTIAPVTPPVTAPSAGSSAMRLWGAIVGGAGVVGMGAGIFLGLAAKSKDNTAEGEAGAARQTDSQSAARQGNVATIVFGVGAAALVGGAVLWLVAPSPRAALGTNGREALLRWSF